MIIGMGNDICNISRIEESLERFGGQFEARIFTPAEREKAQSRAGGGARAIANTYAKRFAAKEACMKALGVAAGQGISWQDMEVGNAVNGAPHLTLTGAAHARLQALVPTGMKPVLWLSLSDDYPYALAQVIIEAVPALPEGA